MLRKNQNKNQLHDELFVNFENRTIGVHKIDALSIQIEKISSTTNNIPIQFDLAVLSIESIYTESKCKSRIEFCLNIRLIGEYVGGFDVVFVVIS